MSRDRRPPKHPTWPGTSRSIMIGDSTRVDRGRSTFVGAIAGIDEHTVDVIADDDGDYHVGVAIELIEPCIRPQPPGPEPAAWDARADMPVTATQVALVTVIVSLFAAGGVVIVGMLP